MEKDTLYQLALARVDGIGPVYTKRLIEIFGDAASVFRADRQSLEHARLNGKLIDAILGFNEWPALDNELRRMRNEGIRPIFFTDPDYPHRLKPLPKAPALLFYQGVADLNAKKIIAIAGTRQPSEYGKQMTARIIRDLARPDLLILSGLAFGIDAIAHHTAMKCQLPTIGVLGHGPDQIYPAEHFGLSRAMLRSGGLLTSFACGTGPESHTFPVRNQLLAALCDALIIIESSSDGGSMSAANAALAANKKIFALPGRITDPKSQGCLQLIHGQHAEAFLSAEQFNAAMGWHWPTPAENYSSHQPALPFSSRLHRYPPAPHRIKRQPVLRTTTPARPAPAAPDLNPIQDGLEQELIALLKEKETLTFEAFIDLIHQPIPSISLALLNLEIKGAIRTLPGKRYRLAC